MVNEHDRRNKRLFTHPKLVEELLTYFVDEDFVKELDFSTLERLDKSFITDDFKEKESDLIYKIDFKGSELYIYLLLEFQSTVDKFMSLRMLRYITEFYEFLVYNKRVKSLPAVFPLLLYNGDRKWTAPSDIRELIHPDIPEQYIPGFQYYKIIENELSSQTLLQIKNMVSAIFYIENMSPEELGDHIQDILKLLESEQPELFDLFGAWFNNVLGSRAGEFDGHLSSLQEVQNMFATALKEYDKTLELKGRKAEKFETARKMLEKGFSLKDIVEITGLSYEEINTFLNKG